MAVPYTEGKNSEKGDPSGGHTSRGAGIDAGATPGSTSNENTRIGKLDKRTKGMDSGSYPK